ncbi:MAG: UDP-N-acetylmuramoyl-L-alanine--D-glutamate ligase [Elusimicrobia bacterium]|nr:MAG: UDP-N-acetylmuramoyl-L-alanine--D-glutamate ligase [Elusimicrobiota bacterium]
MVKKKKTKKKAVRKKRPRPLLAHAFTPKAYKGRKAVVLGLGKSGLAAAKLLARKGFRVFVSDSRPRRELRDIAKKLPASVRWEAGGHSDKILDHHFIVKSPGIPHHTPILAKAREAGMPVFSEVEVALAFAPKIKVIAVTGTNGKTTTATMTAAAFKSGRKKVHLLGNIGETVSGSVSKLRKGDTVILEVSSYQLEDSRYFKPDAAAILNITSDHLDHHGSMQAYVEAKTRIFRRQDHDNFCIFNTDDPLSFGLTRECRARKIFFSRTPTNRSAAWLEKKKICLRMHGEKKTHKIAPPKIPGAHNLDNAMAAALLAACQGVKPAAIAKAFKNFKSVEHRLEDIGKVGNLLCLNDSKATNVDSTIAALRSLDDRAGKILLVLGGVQKPGGFKALRPHIETRVKAVFAIGNAAPKIEEDLQGVTHVFPCGTLEQAVQVAYQIGQKGESLVLSPACASFDQFESFGHRGRAFKDLVKKFGRKKR